MRKASNYAQSIVVLSLFVVYELMFNFWIDGDKECSYVNLNQPALDSLQDVTKRLEYKVYERDSLISKLSNTESIQRDKVFDNLEDKFYEAEDSVKERLINEALDGIKFK